jgi:hypothetical protein
MSFAEFSLLKCLFFLIVLKRVQAESVGATLLLASDSQLVLPERGLLW